ncbi:MAG: ribbon-helix-helix protein, CopG family [Rhizobiales bacterium]|nr:ribbon-helix-helix protein, CopG family [Hyphomicrobiales bacterium]
MAEKKQAPKGRKPVGGGEKKRQFLATMDADVIKAVKLAAIENEISASEILEDAARQWLDRRAKNKKG